MSHAESLAKSAAALRIVRGTPDEAELAALVAGVVAMASVTEDEAPGAPTSAWMDRSRSLRGRPIRGPLGRGEAAWRHSLR